MKKWLFVFFLSIFFYQCVSSAEFSASTKRLRGKLEKGLQKGLSVEATLSRPDQERFLIRRVEGTLSARALIRVEPSFPAAELDALGIRLDHLDGDIGSVTIPLHALSDLASVSSIRWVEIDTPIRSRLDVAGADVRANLAHDGVGLSSPRRGAGVIVGVIDHGFDYTHPVFRDAGGGIRIASAWDQSSASGLPPAGFGYGSEWTTPAQLLNQGHDSAIGGEYETHGTHVAGIACGRAADIQSKYWGMAPEAQLVLVSYGGGASDIFDAVEYIFDLAEKAGKPAVINMSMGSHNGPHDGTSTLDRYFDRHVGSGKILVGSAGNEGDDSLHISHVFTGDTISTSPVLQPDDESEYGLIEIWGAPNASVSVAAGLFDETTGEMAFGGDFYNSTLDDAFGATYHLPSGGEMSINGGAVKKNPYNDRPSIQLEIQNGTEYTAVIAVTASNGMVHLWNATESPFSNLGHPEYFEAGDQEYSVGEIGGTSKSVISVGAYVTKAEYESIDGFTYSTGEEENLHNLADFSSRGPTTDGRVKPDIAAPGELVVAAASSRSAQVMVEETVEKIQNQWPLVAYGGTSMSSPLVAGVVALMLEADPSLAPADILTIFRQTAREDAFTGNIPSGGSNLWGFGKVDALAALQESRVEGSEATLPGGFRLDQNWPNPFNPTTQVVFSLPVTSEVELKVFDLGGREVVTATREKFDAGEHAVLIQVDRLTSGVYLYRLQAGSFQQTRKMMVLK